MRQERRRMEERTHAHLSCKAQLHIQYVTLFQWHFLWRKVSLSFTHNIYAHTDPVYTHKYTRQQPRVLHTHTQSHLSCTDILGSTNQLPVSQYNLIGHFWAVSRYRKFLHDSDLCFTRAVGGVITLLSATVKDPDFEKSWRKTAVNTDDVVA